MKITDCKIGEPYQIREFDDMAEEYGLGVCGGIKLPINFTTFMKHLCGRTVMISKIEGERIYLENWSDISGDLDCYFSADMLKPVKIDLTKKQLDDLAISHRDNYSKQITTEAYVFSTKRDYRQGTCNKCRFAQKTHTMMDNTARYTTLFCARVNYRPPKSYSGFDEINHETWCGKFEQKIIFKKT